MTVEFERQVVEGPQRQGEDERIVWTVDISTWGSSPSNVSVVVKDEAGTNVTATKATGLPVVASATLINTPVIHSLSAGTQYRVEVKFTVNGQVFECYFILIAEV